MIISQKLVLYELNTKHPNCKSIFNTARDPIILRPLGTDQIPPQV